jgi:hypothetical protein
VILVSVFIQRLSIVFALLLYYAWCFRQISKPLFLVCIHNSIVTHSSLSCYLLATYKTHQVRTTVSSFRIYVYILSHVSTAYTQYSIFSSLPSLPAGIKTQLRQQFCRRRKVRAIASVVLYHQESECVQSLSLGACAVMNPTQGISSAASSTISEVISVK